LEFKDSNNLDFNLSLLKKGDMKIFKTIFDAFHKRLYLFSFKYVKDKHASEEIIDGVFFILWQKREELDNIKNLKSYLYTMVYNSSMDYLKNKKRFSQFNSEAHDTHFSIEKDIIEEETHTILFNALESLPEKCRQIFELSCLEGLKYKDIAEDLQISINTVKSQRARALVILRQKLKDYPFFQLLLSVI